eukprot:6482777-Amphidinium_carterae.1
MYSALGVSADLIDVLASQMHLFFDVETGTMQISEKCLRSSDGFDMLTGVLCQLWRFPSFTASRWATIGVACRTYLTAQCTGFQSMFRYLRSNGLFTDWEGSGGDRVDEE